MSRDAYRIQPGKAQRFGIAGLPIRYRNELAGGVSLRLADTYGRFAHERAESAVALDIRVGSVEELEPAPPDEPLGTAVHWSLHGSSKHAVFDFVHVPTSRVYCRARLEPDAATAEIHFAEATWRAGGGGRVDPEGRGLPFPLEQLLLLPTFALNGVVLLHAGGGLLGSREAGNERAFLYAGHSGDGKTTLSGLLARDGVPLLSDERVAVRRRDGQFIAYGTPWSGTGKVAAALSAPLAMALLLRKAARHALSEPDPRLLPELVSRAIVPYYFRDHAERMLETFSELSRVVPVQSLAFARAPGVVAELERASRDVPGRAAKTSYLASAEPSASVA